MKHHAFLLSFLAVVLLAGCSSPPPPPLLLPVRVEVQAANPLTDADKKIIADFFDEDFYVADEEEALTRVTFSALILAGKGRPEIDCGATVVYIYRGYLPELLKKELEPALSITAGDRGGVMNDNDRAELRFKSADIMRLKPPPPPAPKSLSTNKEIL